MLEQTSRRRFLSRSAMLAPALLPMGCTSAFRSVLAPSAPGLVDIGTRSFVNRMYDGLDKSRVWDCHAHPLSDGKAGSGGYLNESYETKWSDRIRKQLFLASAGIEDTDNAENEGLDLLLTCWRLANPEGKIVLFAFDAAHDENGVEVPEHTTFYTPNEWVGKIAAKNNDVEWLASVHPYRDDAIDRLEKARANGALGVKWLPNSMLMDTGSPKCDAFYKKLAELEMVLVVHAGEEMATVSVDPDAGNPLRLRRPLDAGCRIVVAHCAGLGDVMDTDGDSQPMKSYDAFRRLMSEKQYEGHLFADISAMTQFNRTGEALDQTLMDTELHARLINGSDYPLPVIDFLISTRWLERYDYLERNDRIQCNRVFEKNPLLFDFCLKRAMRIERNGRIGKFSDIVFESSRVFEHLL